MKIKRLVTAVIVSILAGSVSGCGSIGANANQDTIQASGVIEAKQISIAAETSGKVSQVFVAEGERVEQGDLLIELEDDLLQTQLSQAQAQLESTAAQLDGAVAAEEAARAALTAAEFNAEAAEIHYRSTLSAVLSEESDRRVENWNQNTPNQIDLPAWYFQKTEQISAAEQELALAWEFYQAELDNYQDTIEDIDSDGFTSAETRLAKAQAAFEVAELLQDRPVGYNQREEIEDFVDSIFDKAETELEAAQKAYNELLADPEYERILESRARVSVARERYDLTRDYLFSLYTGEFTFEVQIADAAVAQAEAGVALAQAQITQAENNRVSLEYALGQAEGALQIINLEIDKLKIKAPISGTVLNRTIDPGEILSAGYTAITIGDLSQLSVTVYLPEDRYGQIQLGSKAELRVDSFPGEVFEAEVMRIADQAEYTPRNVQTQEERKNTVYAVELSVTNANEKLKPGMPADVVFLP